MRLLAAWVVVLGLARVADAHEGPPYPVLIDRVTGPYRVSVWADPDVGTGTFHIYIESSSARPLAPASEVELRVRPLDQRLPEVGYPARPRRPLQGTQRFEAKAQFDSAGPWQVRLRLVSPAGAAEADTVVAVTPPGNGPVIDFLIYLFPFVAVGFLFVKAAMRRRKGWQAPAG